MSTSPGTLWCGLNDIAESYTSLGDNQELDRSARDISVVFKLSPVSDVAGFTTSVLIRSNHSPASRGSSTRRHGPSKSTNTSMLLVIMRFRRPNPFRSNCECEKIFLDCLHQVSSLTADSLGRFYFNFLQLKCIDIRHPARWLI